MSEAGAEQKNDTGACAVGSQSGLQIRKFASGHGPLGEPLDQTQVDQVPASQKPGRGAGSAADPELTSIVGSGSKDAPTGRVSAPGAVGSDGAGSAAAATSAPPAASTAAGYPSMNSSEGRVPVAAADAAVADNAGRDPAAGLATSKQQQQPPSDHPSLSQRLSLSATGPCPEVWGWLQPAPGTKLPFVLLQGRGVALGRGREEFLERLPQLMAALSRSSSLSQPSSGLLSLAAAPSSSSQGHPASLLQPDGQAGGLLAAPAAAAVTGATVGERGTAAAGRDAPLGDSSFVEVPDGRVSRLHAWVKWDDGRQRAVLEDLSSNGTFLNGERLGRGRRATLADGDRISLVLSVAPLAEQAFTFHTGDPRCLEGQAAAAWATSCPAAPWLQQSLSRGSLGEQAEGPGSTSATLAAEGAPGLPAGRPGSPPARPGSGVATAAAPAAAHRRLARSATSRYSTLHAISPEDLQCQICLSPLSSCVALQPCGHNFCAACLSHHLAALLGAGQPLACPLRCAPPTRVVANSAVRQLLSGSAAPSLTDSSPRHSHGQQARHPQPLHEPGSVLEPLPEAPTGSTLPPGSSLSSRASGASPRRAAGHSHSHSQEMLRTHPGRQQLISAGSPRPGAASPTAAAPGLAAQQLGVTAQPPAGPGSSSSSAASGELSPDRQSPTFDYRHVELGPASAGSSLASPPASPFESLATAAGFPARQGGGQGADSGQQRLALPGEPTSPAASPFGAAAAAANGAVRGATALPGAPTLAAEVPLPRQQSAAATGALAQLPTVPAAAGAQLPRLARSSAADASAAADLHAGRRPTQQQEQEEEQEQDDVADAEPGSSPAASASSCAGGCSPGGTPAAASPAVASPDPEEDAPLAMHPLCPLHDWLLPLDTAGLKSRQLSHSMELLQSGSGDQEEAMSQLEALARLAWSDEGARRQLGELDGVRAIVDCMRQHLGSEGVQCNGCLALMALVRGDGEASDANRLRLAECGGVEAIAEGMAAHADMPIVQLSALLCLVPVALENTYLQVLVAGSCLPIILAAIQRHPGEPEVVSKAMIMLGVLGQGDDPAHDAICLTIMTRTPFPAMAAGVLRQLGATSEEVLWSVLFALAVIVRNSSGSYIEHLLSLASAGVRPALQAAMAAYRRAVAQQGGEADEMILRAGDFLESVLGKAQQLLWIRRTRRWTRLAMVGVAALAAYRFLRHRAGHRLSLGSAASGASK